MSAELRYACAETLRAGQLRSGAGEAAGCGRVRCVAYVVHTFDAGGLERCAAHFANYLPREDYRPLIICLNRSGTAARWITAADVPIIELHKRSGNDLSVVGRLARALREHQVHLVQSHNWGTLLETKLAARRAGGVRHVHTEHGQELAATRIAGLKLRMHRWARRWAFRRTDAVVACAESVRQRLEGQWGFPSSRVRFIPNGVARPAASAEGSARLRSSLGLSPTSMLVGSVGRLAPIKDFATAVAAVARLVTRGRDLHLVLVGDGPERESLVRLASDYGVASRVHLVGHRDDVGDWLGACDIYVNCSLGEAMSMSILEAMAVGLPVVATDVGDTGSLLGRDCAGSRLVPPGNPAALAEALDHLALDADERRSVGRDAEQRYASQYSAETMVSGYVELYRELLSARLCKTAGIPA